MAVHVGELVVWEEAEEWWEPEERGEVTEEQESKMATSNIYIYIRTQSDQLKIRLGTFIYKNAKSNLQLIRLCSNINAIVFLLSTLTAVLQIN